jgi:hypothetical protein
MKIYCAIFLVAVNANLVHASSLRGNTAHQENVTPTKAEKNRRLAPGGLGTGPGGFVRDEAHTQDDITKNTLAIQKLVDEIASLKNYVDIQAKTLPAVVKAYVDGQDTALRDSLKPYIDYKDTSLTTYVDNQDKTLAARIETLEQLHA